MAKPAKAPAVDKMTTQVMDLAGEMAKAAREDFPDMPDLGEISYRLECTSEAVVTLKVEGARLTLQANGPHAPLCPPARLTLAEAEAVAKQLGKACAALRGVKA